MDTALSGIIILTVILVSLVTLAYVYLSLHEGVVESFEVMEARMNARIKTDLTPMDAQTQPEGTGSLVRITLKNEGDTKSADFDQWDVIVEYDSLASGDIVGWLPYDDPSEDRYWDKVIYLDASEGTGEAFEPNILNPGEEIVVQLHITPSVKVGTNNRATIVTDNGISASTVFTN